MSKGGYWVCDMYDNGTNINMDKCNYTLWTNSHLD